MTAIRRITVGTTGARYSLFGHVASLIERPPADAPDRGDTSAAAPKRRRRF
jgi:hypothetical protein